MHKKAFLSYKKFEFLKAGILTPEQREEEEGRQRVGFGSENGPFEPYDYPPLRKSVASLLTDGVQSRMTSGGRMLT